MHTKCLQSTLYTSPDNGLLQVLTRTGILINEQLTLTPKNIPTSKIGVWASNGLSVPS